MTSFRLAARRTVASSGLAALLLAAPFSVAMPEPADAASKNVVRKCRGDYNRLCPGYKVDSDDLRACMRSKHTAISNSCMNALVDAGEAPRSARRR